MTLINDHDPDHSDDDTATAAKNGDGDDDIIATLECTKDGPFLESMIDPTIDHHML